MLKLPESRTDSKNFTISVKTFISLTRLKVAKEVTLNIRKTIFLTRKPQKPKNCVEKVSRKCGISKNSEKMFSAKKPYEPLKTLFHNTNQSDPSVKKLREKSHVTKKPQMDLVFWYTHKTGKPLFLLLETLKKQKLRKIFRSRKKISTTYAIVLFFITRPIPVTN